MSYLSVVATVNSQGAELLIGNRSRLVQDTEHGNDILPVWLGEEFGIDTYIIKGSLSVSIPHCTYEQVGLSLLSRMVKS